MFLKSSLSFFVTRAVYFGHFSYIFSESFDLIILSYFSFSLSQDVKDIIAVFSSGYVIRFLLAPIVGYIIDKYNKKTIVLVGFLLRFLSLFTLYLLSDNLNVLNLSLITSLWEVSSFIPMEYVLW